MRRIQIYDTTLRDGTQGEGVNFSLAGQAADHASGSMSSGFDYIEGGYPGFQSQRTPNTFSGSRELNSQACQGLRASA